MTDRNTKWPRAAILRAGTTAGICIVGALGLGLAACSSDATSANGGGGGPDAAPSEEAAAAASSGASSGGASTGGASGATATSGSSSGFDASATTGSDAGSGSGGSGSSGNPGSGGVDAGDATSARSAQDGGAIAPCAASHYLICEDFESTGPGAIPSGWTPQGDVAVATDDAYQGTHSLKLSVVGTKAENYRGISMNPSQLGTGHWGRIHYKVQAPPPKYFAHDTFVSLTGNGPDNGFQNESVRVVDTVQQASNMHQFLYNVQPSGSEFGKGSAYKYTFADGGWHCAEWHIDNPTQSYQFYYDGVEVSDIAITNGPGKNTNSEIPAVFTKLTVGISQYQSPPQGYSMQPVWFTAWIDDVALDTNRIGCQ